MRKQYQERTTLHTWGVLQRALQVSQPGYSALMWHHEHKPQGIHCEGFHSEEGPHNCFEQSMRNPLECDQVWIALRNHPEAVIGQATINLIPKFGNPLRIPYPNCTALLSGAYVTQESWAWGFLWVRKVWFATPQQMFAPETFGERWKGRIRSPVVSLLTGFLEHLALRNPCVLCQKHGGTHTMYYLGVPKV
jgi:hypothetical protein